MSSHSRSSSEIESVQLSEILPVYIEDFFKDFSFDDVKRRVNDASIFTKTEYAYITEDPDPDEKRQIFRLFWTLYSKEHVIKRFLESLRLDYDWLVDKVLKEHANPQNKTTARYIDALKVLRNKHQNHMDYNVHRIDKFLELRRALRQLKPHHKVVLLGELGIGKKWLALDVCCEFTVLRAMDFKIYWIDVSQCTSPEDDLRMLQHFQLLLRDSNASLSPSPYGTIHRHKGSLEFYDTISNRILDLQQNLRLKLKKDDYKNCLLVLKNVQNVQTWERFNLGCKLLIITRNKKVSESLSPKMCHHIALDEGLTLPEFFCLFEKYFQCSRNEFPEHATKLFWYSKGHPYLLSIIAQHLRHKRQSNDDWNNWIQNLQNHEITDNKFTAVVELSLDVLPADMLKLYATFGIFMHSISIPVKLLATLWNKSLPEAEAIVQRFHKFSLVSKDVLPDGTTVCDLPFIYSTHLKGSQKMLAMINSHELHSKVIAYYKVDTIFEYRTEIHLCTSLHDLYFFCCVGYHLQEARRDDLFSQIYLDFGFLEQKMRVVGMLNTIADLKFYEDRIYNYDHRRRDLLREICEFLPKIEEKFVNCKDTCLLQSALMAGGLVYEEALRQVKQFPDKVWFAEKGNFHRNREIVNLTNQPKFVRILEQDICLIVLVDNNMILVDYSLDYTSNPVTLIKDDNNKAAITDVQLFRNDNYVLALDDRGELKFWAISDNRRASLVHRRSSRQKVNPLNFNRFPRMQAKPCKQSIREYNFGKNYPIVAFHIEQLPEKYDGTTKLHVAYDNGDINVFEWNVDREEFQWQRVPILPTGFQHIKVLSKILGKYYMLLNDKGQINFWNLRDSSKVSVSFEWPEPSSGLVSYDISTFEPNGRLPILRIIFVFGDRILRLTFEKQRFAYLIGKLDVLYEYSGVHNYISCAKLSSDGRYLVMGTKNGLIVFDTDSKSEILRSNVSEAITCVDVYAIDDPIFKYVIICGSKHKSVLHIFPLRGTAENSVGWAHYVSTNNEPCDEPQLEPNVWLPGKKLYDITYGKGTLLVAADSKGRIHRVCTSNRKNWSLVMPIEQAAEITAITTTNSRSFAGYSNGAVYDIIKEQLEKSFTTERISYLQLFEDRVLVASAECEPITHIKHLPSELSLNVKIDAKKCFLIFEHFLVLINKDGIVLALDVDQKFARVGKWDDVRADENGCFFSMSGCDFKNSHLFLVTTTFNIHVYEFAVKNNTLVALNYFRSNKNEIVRSKVSSLAASNDASLVAVGLENGDIEVYKMSDDNSLNFHYRLLSHVSEIYDMKFSPHNEVLVSSSEQMCFWSVSFMLNNPLNSGSSKRRSSRFSSQRSSDPETVDASVVVNKHLNFLKVSNGDEPPDFGPFSPASSPQQVSPWQHKQGPQEKPELLACIKYEGNKAEQIFANADFTQFNTIDDEGVYYHLTLLDVSNSPARDHGTNGHKNATINVADEDYDDDDDSVIN